MITQQRQDTLAEVLNIGFGRAASALSEITGYRVLLDPPVVEVAKVNDLFGALRSIAEGQVASVHQVFSGPVSGDAILILPAQDGAVLARLLAAGDEAPTALSLSDREVLTEIGNILLNACLGTFGNLLQVHLTFTVPCIYVQSLTALVSSMVADGEELRYALVITAKFNVRDTSISGRLVMILGVTSLERLLQAVGDFDQSV